MRRFLPFRSRIITGEHLLPGYSVESSKTILAHPGNLCYIFCVGTGRPGRHESLKNTIREKTYE